MTRPLVKICGITTADDARLCHAAGADFLGVVFAMSPRQVTEPRARAIRDAVPDAQLVGVFTDTPPDAVAAVTETVGLDLVQLHGSDDPAHWDAVHRAAGVPLLPAVTAAQIERTTVGHAARTHPDVAALLLDLPKHAVVGDDDRAALWETARRCSGEGLTIVLAGALDAESAPKAVAAARPFGIDVSRGVESAPGVKDATLVRRFLAAVRNAEVVDAV